MVVNGGRAKLEEIMHDLIPELWESGLLAAVSNQIEDMTEILKEAFDFDKKEGSWKIREKTKIGSHIPLESRIKFYLLSCLNKARNENWPLTIDDIIMEGLPFLRNGTTPSNQHIIFRVVWITSCGQRLGKEDALSSGTQNSQTSRNYVRTSSQYGKCFVTFSKGGIHHG